MNDERIQRRSHRILKRKPSRFNLTFGEDGSLALSDLLTVPVFVRREVTLEQLTNALTSDSESRFVVTGDRVNLASA